MAERKLPLGKLHTRVSIGHPLTSLILRVTKGQLNAKELGGGRGTGTTDTTPDAIEARWGPPVDLCRNQRIKSRSESRSQRLPAIRFNHQISPNCGIPASSVAQIWHMAECRLSPGAVICRLTTESPRLPAPELNAKS